jgi:hypothetical protein
MEQLQTEIEQSRIIAGLAEHIEDPPWRRQSRGRRLCRGLAMQDLGADGVLTELPAHLSVQSIEPWN